MIKKSLRKVICILLILSLCSCSIKESYIEFKIKGIENFNAGDSSSWDDMEFAFVEDILLVPSIKQINHGTYILYVSAYTRSKPDNVVVKSVVMTENEKNILSNQTQQKIVFDLTDNNIFDGYIKAGTFDNTNNTIVDGNIIKLTISIEVRKESVSFIEDKNYEITVKGYKSLVMR